MDSDEHLNRRGKLSPFCEKFAEDLRDKWVSLPTGDDLHKVMDIYRSADTRVRSVRLTAHIWIRRVARFRSNTFTVARGVSDSCCGNNL